MKLNYLLLVVGCLLSAAYAGLSGNYTIKPDGSGDFATLSDAGRALDTLGISGDCVFEIFGDTLSSQINVSSVAGSDSWTTTFRPGAGAAPVLAGAVFRANHFSRVRLQNLHFSNAMVNEDNGDGWRISGCRFTVYGQGIELANSRSDTVDGCTFDVVPTGRGHGPPITTASDSCVFFNNFFNCDSAETDVLVDIDQIQGTKVYFNTIRLSPTALDDCGAIWICGGSNSDVRNNVIMLGALADNLDACVRFIWNNHGDTATLDGNCYFVESLGYVGAWHGDDSITRYGWEGWRALGFERNGIYADPMLVSASNLHLRQGSPCIGTATPVPGIEFDIDGDPRDPAHPDIGADEFTGGGIEETPNAEVRTTSVRPTILSSSSVQSLASMVIFDAMGRRVSNPKSGIYFVREAQAQAIRKVIIQR